MPDGLTGLRTHKDGLRGEIDDQVRSCCFVDIDGLQWVNAEDGYIEADRALVAVARRIEETVANEAASVFRVGGDEFLVLFRSLDSAGLRLIAGTIISDIRALWIPYRRRNCPNRTVLEANVALLPVTPAFADRAFHQYGLTPEARDWVADGIYRERHGNPCAAGFVADLIEATDCPWVG